MHPRNRHQGRYDLEQLAKLCPELAAVVKTSPRKDLTIDFSDPAAVKALNRALLKQQYGLDWDIPKGYLCPPIPGRADYVHHLADLLGPEARGAKVRVLDVGTGANCIYPIIGHMEYGWSFVGSEIDPAALTAARKIVQSNRALAGAIELRPQASPADVFSGVLVGKFDATMCNPPFHASLEEAAQGNQRKWTNLGRRPTTGKNFGGQSGEIWCPGGEAGFVHRMIVESAAHKAEVRWFTTLVSKSETLAGAQKSLKKLNAAEVRTIEMAQGQKKSRILAWTFLR